MLSPNVCLVLVLRRKEIIEVERILGMIVTSHDALGAVDAGSLKGPIAILFLVADRERIFEVITEEYVEVH
jgi:hypothetical protein